MGGQRNFDAQDTYAYLTAINIINNYNTKSLLQLYVVAVFSF